MEIYSNKMVILRNILLKDEIILFLLLLYIYIKYIYEYNF